MYFQHARPITLRRADLKTQEPDVCVYRGHFLPLLNNYYRQNCIESLLCTLLNWVLFSYFSSKN